MTETGQHGVVSISALKGVVFDIDGTLAETERHGHLVAFNLAFEEARLDWQWSEQEYGRLLQITGGLERLLHDMAQRTVGPDAPQEREALARALHQRKNEIYLDLIRQGQIAPRNGVLRLVQECADGGLRLAIASTTSRVNAVALIESFFGADGLKLFDAIVCGEDTPLKKPHPMVYELALEKMNESAESMVAIEDSPNGVSAAAAAGLMTVLTPSVFFPIEDSLNTGATVTLDHLDAPFVFRGEQYSRMTIQALRTIHRQAD